jgi:predicted DNA-binding transcriptional regulator AlpA
MNNSEEVLSAYLTRDQLAQELRVTTRTLDKWACARRGPRKVRIGGRCYYHREDVSAWLDRQRAGDSA